MTKRGHEINLAAGVMFSPQREEADMQRARIRIAKQLTVNYMKQFGIEVTIIKRPSKVWEFQFIKNEEMIARRSLEDPAIRRGGRKAAGDMISSVLTQLNIDHNVWADLPEHPDPEPTPRVDNVGAPPETQYQERISPPPAEDVETVDEVEGNLTEPRTELPFDENWTIRELKEWAKQDDTPVPPVPSNITRKGDILEFLANEYSNRSG